MPFPALKRVEAAVDTCEQLLQATLNGNIRNVYAQHADVAGIGKYNLDRVQISRYIIAEAIEPMILPSVFIIADRTEHDLKAEQWAKQTHHLLVSLLCEDVEQQILTRKIWRYAEALFLSLHDQGFGNFRFLVDEMSYSPIFSKKRAGSERSFQKDVTMKVRAMHFETF